MNTWKPITKEEIEALVNKQLLECDEKQRNIFLKHKIAPKKYKIVRYGKTEEVYVVAINNNEAMYYEDVEECFNFSTTNNNLINEHHCEQNELKYVLLHWL